MTDRARSFELVSWTGFAVAALGVAPLAKKAALAGGAAPLPVALASAAVAAAAILAWLALRGNLSELAATDGRQRLAILAVGALGSGLVPLFGVLAMTETSASNRALFQSAYPAATAVAARLLLGDRLSPGVYALIALVCLGLVLVNVDPEAMRLRPAWPFWLLLATLPAIGLADVIAKKVLVDLSPEVVAAGRAGGGAAVLLLTVPLMADGAWASSAPAWGWIVLAGACMGGFAIALYRVFERTRPAIAASLIALAPLITLVAEAGLFGMPLRPLQVVGFALVLAAVAALARRA